MNLVGINVYEVVLEGSAESFHSVTLEPAFYQRCAKAPIPMNGSSFRPLSFCWKMRS